MSGFTFFIFVVCSIKEKKLEKLSINLKPEENSLLRESKNEKIPLR